MWSGLARKSSRKRSGKSFQRSVGEPRFKGLRPLSSEALPLCLQVSVCRNPEARSQSGIRARSSEGLRQTEGGLRQAKQAFRAVYGKNFEVAASHVFGAARFREWPVVARGPRRECRIQRVATLWALLPRASDVNRRAAWGPRRAWCSFLRRTG